MKKIYTIPILGRILQIVRVIIKSPKLLQDLKNQVKEQNEHMESRMGRADKRLDILEQETKSFGLVNEICSNEDALLCLNRELSSHPKIWGDPCRLHIASSANVNPCLLNTNSGEITIGEYTFSGSGVSILAGSHDYNLLGFARRDAELTKDCDVVIGNGVWLASGSTILGPCQIGDNSVIAAGAVVVPGTIIPPNMIYGGIPAHQISTINISENHIGSNDAIQKALERNNGILLISGWSEKKMYPGISEAGHFTLDQRVNFFADQREWLMIYGLDGENGCRIDFSGEGGNKSYLLDAGIGQMEISLPLGERMPDFVTMKVSCCERKLFIVWRNKSILGS